MPRYAETTTVRVDKSRNEIDRLLRDWGCDGIRWTDHFAKGQVGLEFLWTHDDQEYLARFEITLPDDEALRSNARHASSGAFLPAKLAKLKESRGRQEHRLLLLWLKAALNAVDAGIIPAEVLFLPFLVGQDGQTVAQAALPRLRTLLSGGASEMFQLSGGD